MLTIKTDKTFSLYLSLIIQIQLSNHFKFCITLQSNAEERFNKLTQGYEDQVQWFQESRNKFLVINFSLK